MAISSQNLKNSAWSIVNILLYPTAFMGLTPVFIDRMGEMQFGIWMLVNSYVYIAVNIISFGFSNSITAHVAEALGKKDERKLFAYVNASTRILATIAVVTALLAVMAWFVWHAMELSGIRLNLFSGQLDLVLLAATLLISVKFYELLYQSVFKGFERFDLAGKYNIMNKFLVLGLQLILVLKGRGLPDIFLGNLVINIAMVAVQGVVIHRILPGYRFMKQRNPPGE
jgi:O-antigen/teichoic acid export membrane protein